MYNWHFIYWNIKCFSDWLIYRVASVLFCTEANVGMCQVIWLGPIELEMGSFNPYSWRCANAHLYTLPQGRVGCWLKGAAGKAKWRHVCASLLDQFPQKSSYRGHRVALQCTQLSLFLAISTTNLFLHFYNSKSKTCLRFKD